MRNSIRAALVCALAVTTTPILGADPGRTTGVFDVSSTGAATYSIPIWTPPGPNGLTPSISLDYNSQGGNGLAGVGWNLSATASIERCNRTRADGESAAVDLSMNDRFCLGGKRLRLASGTGTYGSPGSVYFTEVADFSRITAYDTHGFGPRYFVVETKDGLKYEYGNTTDSRVVLNGTVLRWMLNRVYDRSGVSVGTGNNYILTYDNANGFAVPNSIFWTPTTLGGSTYLYEAKFNYLTTRAEKDSYVTSQHFARCADAVIT